MTIHKDLGNRMKEYEYVTRHKLIPHMPTILRLDGKSFHSFTKNMKRPFDNEMHKAMCYAMEESMKNIIQNATFGFTQSDEISIVLKDYPNFNTEQFMGGVIQKICSISASAVSTYFNDYIRDAKANMNFPNYGLFDCRVYQLPHEEVCNYFIWRQRDTTKNSIQMLAQHHFSHNELQHKNGKQLQSKLLKDVDVNWNDLEVWQKRGSSCYKLKDGPYIIDDAPPIFTKYRDYIETHLTQFL